VKRATEFAASIGARVTIPSRPLLYRKDGEAKGYFTDTDLQASFDALKKPAQSARPRRVK
jgi:hypothetical protein